jgi:hypothetical protein
MLRNTIFWEQNFDVLDQSYVIFVITVFVAIFGWSAQRSNYFTLCTICNVQYIYQSGKKWKITEITHARPFFSTFLPI